MVKKYWKLLVLLVFTISTLSIYYIQYAKITEFFPQFSFKHVEGDVKDADAFILNGTIEMSMFGGESFRLSAEKGTEYLRDKPFSKRIQGYMLSKEIETRIKEYPGFMRGKEDVDAYFFEDEQYLAYGSTEMGYFDFHYKDFEIDVLNKKTKERSHFKVPIPGVGNYWYADVKAVTMMDDQFIIFSENMETGEDDEEHTNITKYIVDLNNENIKDEEVIYSYVDDYAMNGSGYTTLELLHNKDMPNQDVLIVQNSILYTEEKNGMFLEEMGNRDAVLYDLKTNEKKNLDIPTDAGFLLAYGNDYIYTGELNKQQYKVAKFDREKEEIVDDFVIDTGGTLTDEMNIAPQTDIDDNKLYLGVFPYENHNPSISVVNLEDMTLEYLGSVIANEDNGKKATGYYFDSFELKRN